MERIEYFFKYIFYTLAYNLYILLEEKYTLEDCAVLIMGFFELMFIIIIVVLVRKRIKRKKADKAFYKNHNRDVKYNLSKNEILKEINRYMDSTYYEVTHIQYDSMRDDLGRYGEYLIYDKLRTYESAGSKFLFNIYIPKNSDETSEIDVLMISQKGLFVFESKNYSGWIFGNEHSKYWMQTLATGRNQSHKEKFYNPIKQNDSHIKNLTRYLKMDLTCYSVISFAERTTLKDIEIFRDDVKVITRDKVNQVVEKVFSSTENILTTEQIDEIYKKLYPLTQVSEEVKKKHIDNIENSILQPSQAAVHFKDKKQSEEAEKETKEENQSSSEKEKIMDFLDSVLDEETDSNITPPEPEKEHICPKCGGKLVLRTAHKGDRAGKQFYGCENFPKCRYTKTI